MKLYVMRVQGLQWEYIELFSLYFVNWEEKLFMHQIGVKISIQDNLLNSTILDYLLLLFTSIAKGKMAPVVVVANNYIAGKQSQLSDQRGEEYYIILYYITGAI